MKELVQSLLLALVRREAPHPLEEAPSRNGRDVQMVSNEFEEREGEMIQRRWRSWGVFVCRARGRNEGNASGWRREVWLKSEETIDGFLRVARQELKN